MTYQQVLDFLYSQLPMYQRIGPAAYKHDLSKTLELDKYFGHPHRKFKSIHIAGTNGKGSVAHAIASILQEAGYKTGLYTSPHYLDFRERIKINGFPIPEDFVISFVKDNKSVFDRIKPSFFEMTVAMAFEYFARQQVDIAVIEVGMGGRLDSTNIIKPLVSAITSIGFDHTQFLGNTLTQIAREKAGIIKPGVPVVIGKMQPPVQSVFIQKAAQADSPIYLADYIYKIEHLTPTADGRLSFDIFRTGKMIYPNMRFGLGGIYQQNNIPVILQIAEILQRQYDFNLSDEHIYRGFDRVVQNTGIMGRWHILRSKPLIIADAAHNQDGLKNVFRQALMYKYNNLYIIFGTVQDKAPSLIFPLMPKKARYFFVKSSVPRSMDHNKLKKSAEQYGFQGKAYPTVSQALEEVLTYAEQNDLVLITGSTFVVADAIKYLLN